MGDSGSSFWKEDTIKDNAEKVSTVIGVFSYMDITGYKICGDMSIAHKVAHKDILKWISENWEK